MAVTTIQGSSVPFTVSTDAGSTYKTALISYSEDTNGAGATGVKVTLWRSTSAITNITFTTSTSTFATGTTATLYGIKAA